MAHDIFNTLRQRRFTHLISFGLLVLSFQLFAYRVHAQQVRLSIDPPIVQTKIKPGKSILIAYTTENTGDPVPVKFVIYTFQPVGKTGGVELTELSGPIEFTLENADIALNTPFFFTTKDRRQALVRITVPPTAPEGDYYYMIVAETVPTAPSEGRTASLASAQIGSPLLVTVTESGLTEVQARIFEFSVKNTVNISLLKKRIKLVDSSQQIPVVLAIENLGRNVIQPEGAITIRHGKSETRFQLLGQNILKNSVRIIHTSPTTSADSGISAYLRGFRIGKNTISAQVSYGANSSIQFAHIEVIALPFRILGLVGVALFMSGIILSFRHKKKTDKTDI